MKFLVDEQLPQLLSEWIISKGYDSIRVSSLGTQSVSDSEIRAKSMTERRVVISKDEDFFNSYLLQKQPYKLIFITTGNIKNRALLDLFRAEFETVLSHLQTHDLVEINRTLLKVWF